MKTSVRIAAALLAILLTLGGIPLTSVGAGSAATTYGGTPISKHVGGYDYGFSKRTQVTHGYDFSLDRISHYATDPALAMSNRADAEIKDGALTVKEGKDFIFGSAVGLGDDYGLEEGYLSFDLKLTGGTLYLGVRTSRTAADNTKRGIWFTFDGSSSMRIYEPECGLEATVPMPVSTGEAKTFTLHEGLDTLTLSCGDTVIASVKYSEEGYLAICDGSDAVKAETNESKLYTAGYFSLHLSKMEGYVDNVIFTNVEESWEIPTAESIRSIDYSTWTATDALDRTVADQATAGDPKENRYVGLFYFLCWVGAGVHVQDNTKLYLELGADETIKYIENYGGEAYWAEPYFGYYRNTDTWVYRKHAYMLEQAGVDFIYLDVSNAEVFIPGHTALFDTWLEMRREGIDTPQIVFFNGDTPATFQSNMQKLFTTVYADDNWDKYSELFFMWEGKPLLFGNYSGLSGDVKKKVDEKFTVRGSWAWTDTDNYWPWLQEYIYKPESVRVAQMKNGGWGRDAQGKIESLSIAMGHHPTMSKGRSFVNNKQPNNGLGDMEFSSVERAGLGLGFESQFNAVSYLVDRNVPAEEPFVLMITGWNEWIAGCFHSDGSQSMANTSAGFSYVDQFNVEFSRDGEPMRNQDGYGIGDNYYYQMVSYIRQFKGISATPKADGQTSVNIYDLSSWDGISMTYMDSVYDVEHRNTVSYDADFRYVNNTGRNDFDYAKVSQDEDNLYFLVKTTHDLIIDNDTEWMNLFINVDGDSTTGWEGYDYVLNRDRDSFVVTVEKFKDNTFESEVVGGAYYYTEGAYMAIRLSKELMGVSGKVEKMVFKWADNSVKNGDPMAFMDLGDAAPDNRFGFLYLCEEYITKALPKTTLVTDGGQVSVNGSAVVKPDTDLDISVKDTVIDVLYDLANTSAGLFVKDTPIAEQFELAVGTPSCSGQVLKKEDGSKYVRLKGYTDLRTYNDVEGSYEVSADMHMVDYGNSAIYVRGEMPGAYKPKNPSNHNVDQVFNYFEWDWYAENGGRTFGGSSTAGSGIGIYPDAKAITVRIKRYAPDGLGVASASYTFPYGGKFQPDESGWFKLRVVDDGTTVSIYFNDVLMCLVKLSDPGVIYDSDGTGQEYYGKAILCDASGKEVLTVENTRVNSTGSQIAFTTRSQTMEFANLYIAYKSQNAEGSRLEILLGTAYPTVAYTPDDRLVTTLSTGKDPTYEDEIQETTGAPTDETLPAEDDSVTHAPADTTEGKKGCRSIVILPAALLAGLAGVLLRRREQA